MNPMIQRLADRIRETYRPERIVLFGSHAHGTVGEESDIDLLIVKETDKPFHKRWAEVAALIEPLAKGLDVSPFVMTPAEVEERLRRGDQFVRDILTKGHVLYAA
jgi:predicted nucleotidyltransferase